MPTRIPMIVIIVVVVVVVVVVVAVMIIIVPRIHNMHYDRARLTLAILTADANCKAEVFSSSARAHSTNACGDRSAMTLVHFAESGTYRKPLETAHLRRCAKSRRVASGHWAANSRRDHSIWSGCNLLDTAVDENTRFKAACKATSSTPFQAKGPVLVAITEQSPKSNQLCKYVYTNIYIYTYIYISIHVCIYSNT